MKTEGLRSRRRTYENTRFICMAFTFLINNPRSVFLVFPLQLINIKHIVFLHFNLLKIPVRKTCSREIATCEIINV